MSHESKFLGASDHLSWLLCELSALLNFVGPALQPNPGFGDWFAFKCHDQVQGPVVYILYTVLYTANRNQTQPGGKKVGAECCCNAFWAEHFQNSLENQDRYYKSK